MRKTIDKAICQPGGSKGSRAGMMMGEKRGNSEPKTAKGPLGLVKTEGIITIARITGMVNGIINC